jgi:hypothetical protein
MMEYRELVKSLEGITADPDKVIETVAVLLEGIDQPVVDALREEPAALILASRFVEMSVSKGIRSELSKMLYYLGKLRTAQEPHEKVEYRLHTALYALRAAVLAAAEAGNLDAIKAAIEASWRRHPVLILSAAFSELVPHKRG